MRKIITSYLVIVLIQVLIISGLGVCAGRTSNNSPPSVPDITGIIDGDVGVQYEYEATSTDPNGNLIYYQWDWGDGDISSWIGDYGSGETCTMSHIWLVEGTYIVKVRAADDPAEDGHGDSYNSGDGLVSDWGTLEVTMPCNLEVQYYVQNLHMKSQTVT